MRSSYHLKMRMCCMALGFLAFWFSGIAQTLKVPLKKETISDPPGRFTGISNLFFNKVDSTIQMSFPSDWENVEMDALVRNETVKPIYVFRIKRPAGNEYYIDKNNDQRIENNEQLTFSANGEFKIADFTITPVSLSGTALKPLAFQLILADKYVYGRMTEQRTGMVNLQGQHYKILVRPLSRNAISYSKTASQLFIDLNQDSIIAEQWKYEKDVLVQGEEIAPSDPFKLNGKGYMVESIDANGDWITLKPFTSATALGVGYKFPSIQLNDMDGKLMGVGNKKYSLIELWSVSCPFCELIRNKLNALKSQVGEQLDWIAISREQKQPVSEFLSNHPLDATIAIPSAEQWAYLNPTTVTPLFYLIDPNGTIVLKGQGASMYNIIEPIVKARK